MRNTKPKSGSSVSVRDFGIDDERPLLSGLHLTRIDSNCCSDESGAVRPW